MQRSVLLIDDEASVAIALQKYFALQGYRIFTAPDLLKARNLISIRRFDALLLDLNLPDGSGLDLIPELRQINASIPIVVVTGVSDISIAVEAMRRGADHYMTKPINLCDLEVFLQKSIELGSLRKRNFVHKRYADRREPFLGNTAPSKKIQSLLQMAAETQMPVLLSGETGTGKGMFARWIYSHSKLAEMPFVEVNCSALRGDLLWSELFGHVKGAFTSASETRQGLLDVADGGTLFLDEIGDMSLEVQSQFLKVLEEKRYRRLGDVQERHSEFRLICATNRNLSVEVEESRFRKDLFFRIHVFPIHVNPLREKLSELEPLIKHLLAELNAPDTELSNEAFDCLSNYHWPGNIRELRNVLERALLLGQRQKILLPEHFPGLDPAEATGDDSAQAGEGRLQQLMRQYEGDKEKVAREMGISRATLYRRLKSIGGAKGR